MFKTATLIALAFASFGSEAPKRTSASVPPAALTRSFPLTRTTPWIRCDGIVYINGIAIYCSKCMNLPIAIRMVDGKIEAYCAEHKK